MSFCFKVKLKTFIYCRIDCPNILIKYHFSLFDKNPSGRTSIFNDVMAFSGYSPGSGFGFYSSWSFIHCYSFALIISICQLFVYWWRITNVTNVHLSFISEHLQYKVFEEIIYIKLSRCSSFSMISTTNKQTGAVHLLWIRS